MAGKNKNGSRCAASPKGRGQQAHVHSEDTTPQTPLFGSLSELDPVLGPNWTSMHPGTTQLLLDLDQENHYLLKHDPLPLGDHELSGVTIPDVRVGGHHAHHQESNSVVDSGLGLRVGEGPEQARGRKAPEQSANSNKRKATEVGDKNTNVTQSVSTSKNAEGNGIVKFDGQQADGNGANVPANNKKHQLSKDAASAKADRERKRRERLNKCFEELAQACAGEIGEGGDLCKTDRMSIIVDAIRVVKALRVEVNQLRQLNKFMEERVGQLERGRVADVYSNYSMRSGLAAGAGPSGCGVGCGGSGRVGGVNLACGSAPCDGHHGHHGHHHTHHGHRHGCHDHGHDQNMTAMGTVISQQHRHHQSFVPANDGLGSLCTGSDLGHCHAPASLAYLPPPNLSEDEKLRPPAA
jgi:hypothetical protein